MNNIVGYIYLEFITEKDIKDYISYMGYYLADDHTIRQSYNPDVRGTWGKYEGGAWWTRID
jgi:hypothetical protein